MNKMTITAPISFNSKWLIQTLSKFEITNEHLELRVEATDRVVDFDGESLQLAIRYCKQPPVNLASLMLFSDDVFPVCSPKVRETLGTLQHPSDLLNQILLHDQMSDYTWHDWFNAFGLSHHKSISGPRFSHSANAIDAAIENQGVALGRLPLVANDLIKRRLEKLFSFSNESNYAYYIVFPEKFASNPLFASVVDFLTRMSKITLQDLKFI